MATGPSHKHQARFTKYIGNTHCLSLVQHKSHYPLQNKKTMYNYLMTKKLPLRRQYLTSTSNTDREHILFTRNVLIN